MTARALRYPPVRRDPRRRRAFRLNIERVPVPGDGAGPLRHPARGVLRRRGKDPSGGRCHATPLQTARVLDALVAAVRASGHQAGVLEPDARSPHPARRTRRRSPRACSARREPIAKPARIRRMVAGVRWMSAEETYYWYGKAVGPDADRVRRALRLFLAEE